MLNHVLLHQTVIGQEAQKQMEHGRRVPGRRHRLRRRRQQLRRAGASRSSRDKLRGQARPRIVAVEPTACPTLTKGVYAYDFGDTAKLTPLVKMHTLGHDFMPPGIHAGGLRYHGAARW